MKVWYDTEFLERGAEASIQLISIGAVREDGEELYLINGEFPVNSFLNPRNKWLNHNVMPYLPLRINPLGGLAREGGTTDWIEWDEAKPDYDNVFNLASIREKIRHFVLADDDPELWAWYGAYDHVVLCSLFGRMMDLPSGFPMWTNDVRQEQARLGEPVLPAQISTKHHALEDARWTRKAWQYLQTNSL